MSAHIVAPEIKRAWTRQRCEVIALAAPMSRVGRRFSPFRRSYAQDFPNARHAGVCSCLHDRAGGDQ